MYDRSKPMAPEDRVLHWVATVSVRYPRGIPVDRFVRHLKVDLAPLTFAQLDGALRILEGHGLVRREWDSPGEFRVILTDTGTQQAKLLEEPAPRSIVLNNPPPYTPTPQAPVVLRQATAAPMQAPFAPPSPPVPAPAAPAPAPAGAYRPVPITPATPVSAPEPVAAPPVSSLAGPAQGRSAGPIPSRGPPTSANVPVRVLLYLFLYGAARGEDFPLVPGEDLARYLLNQGFMLSEEFLNRLFAGLQVRDLLTYAPRANGGYDLQLSPRGRQLAEGLISGRVTLQSPDGSLPPSPPGGGARPLTPEEELEDRWAAAEVANTELRKESEALRAALSESEARRNEDRQTLDETLHQMELQENKVQELEEMVARMPKAGLPLDAPPEDGPPLPQPSSEATSEPPADPVSDPPPDPSSDPPA